MTTDPQENQIEDQILKSLDGALDDQALLELQRTVLRDPQARRLMEEHERIDALAGEVIRAAVDDGPLSFDPMALTRTAPAPPIVRHHWSWWMIPGAMAAAIAIVLIIPDVTPPSAPRGQLAGRTPSQIEAPVPQIAAGGDRRPVDFGGVIPVSNPPKRVRRQTLRDFTGVIGADGRLYLIEIDRTRTLRRARGQGAHRPSDNGM